jgi:hypothetical protein
MVVELDPLELSLLWHLSREPERVEEALGELRRRHHDLPFWETSESDPFPGLADPVAVLRRFHREAGFYTSTHAPRESLQKWAQPALQVLLQSQVWSTDAGTQVLWFPWGMEGAGSSLRRRPDPEEFLEQLGGQELVVVSADGDAIRKAHQAGRLFRGAAFGLRVVPSPASRHPQRPAAGFEVSLEELIEVVDQLYRERPFGMLLTDSGAYRLPLAKAVVSRYGVSAICTNDAAARWLNHL